MEEFSFHEKESHNDNSIQHRLSESRPKFKPVLVKKLLADESDDDSDDPPKSDDSDEELDDFDDGLQPLPDDIDNGDKMKASLITKANDEVDIVVKDKAAIVITNDGNTIEKVELSKINDSNARCKESETKSGLNSYLKDSLRIGEYVSKKPEEEKLLLGKTSGTKSMCFKDSSNIDSVPLQSDRQLKPATILDKRKSSTLKDPSDSNVKPKYSPDTKRHSNNSIMNQDSQEPHRFSSSSLNKQPSNETEEKPLVSSMVDQMSNTKCSFSQSMTNTSVSVLDTPMKQSQGSTRPNPCHSHRNIFQTPQNKMGSEFAKNSAQTPATIFSHWSQQHMAQTPMQGRSTSKRESRESREAVQALPTTVAQSQSSRHENQRYFTGESKTVRRPLAETMYSAPTHGPQLPRLQEAPNESHPSPPISREVYSSSHTVHETKENRNPNPHEIVKNESHSKLPIYETKHGINTNIESNPKIEYHNNAYSNMQPPRKVDNYQVRENQSTHPPVSSQSEQIKTIQCSIPQQHNLWNSRENKIITIKDRQYLVLNPIGQGMSCEVVRAQDLSSSELRAIKCVNLSKMDKDSAQGCLQEICMLDRLKAPCIVHMYNFEIKQPWVYVVMEIGDTDLSRLLKSMLQEKKQLPLTMILYYWTEMLTAVKHIHENGVIHSDLKPANFLLVRGRLKLIDFGIASNINSDMTSVVKNCPIGTLNYISPEALMDVNAGSTDSPNHSNKFKISYKSDVWSLGCILYGLVYGVTPFNHIRQQWAKISAITDPKHKINFPLKTGSEPVPLILIDVMRKCLQRDAKARPTVAELLDIPYLQSNQSIINMNDISIPSNILIKIKQALTDDEWKQLTEILEARRKP